MKSSPRRLDRELTTWDWTKVANERWESHLRPVTKRLAEAATNPSYKLLDIRCGCGCGRVVGEVLQSCRGLLVLTRESKPDPMQGSEQKGPKVPDSTDVSALFLDEIESVEFRCRRSKTTELSADEMLRATKEHRAEIVSRRKEPRLAP